MRAIHGGKMASHTHVIGCRAPVSHGVSRWRLLLYWIRRSLLLPLCLLASLSSCVLKEGLPSLLAALASLETPAAYRMSQYGRSLSLGRIEFQVPRLASLPMLRLRCVKPSACLLPPERSAIYFITTHLPPSAAILLHLSPSLSCPNP